jgi:hypothetical protein
MHLHGGGTDHPFLALHDRDVKTVRRRGFVPFMARDVTMVA